MVKLSPWTDKDAPNVLDASTPKPKEVAPPDVPVRVKVHCGMGVLTAMPVGRVWSNLNTPSTLTVSRQLKPPASASCVDDGLLASLSVKAPLPLEDSVGPINW